MGTKATEAWPNPWRSVGIIMMECKRCLHKTSNYAEFKGRNFNFVLCVPDCFDLMYEALVNAKKCPNPIKCTNCDFLQADDVWNTYEYICQSCGYNNAGKCDAYDRIPCVDCQGRHIFVPVNGRLITNCLTCFLGITSSSGLTMSPGSAPTGASMAPGDVVVVKDYPHTCNYCNAPAYIGFSTYECSAQCSQSLLRAKG